MTHRQQTAQFARLMAQELNANADKKGQFSDWHPTKQYLLRELRYHTKKLETALKQGAVVSTSEFAADVANFAMKAHQEFGLK